MRLQVVHDGQGKIVAAVVLPNLGDDRVVKLGFVPTEGQTVAMVAVPTEHERTELIELCASLQVDTKAKRPTLKRRDA